MANKMERFTAQAQRVLSVAQEARLKGCKLRTQRLKTRTFQPCGDRNNVLK